DYVATGHILTGLIREGDNVGAQVLLKFGADLNRTREQVIDLLHRYPGESLTLVMDPQELVQSRSPVLDEVGQNLTQIAREGRLGPVIGRHKEIERVTQVLCRQTQHNPIIVGEPGVGRTAVVHGLAHRMAADEVPRPLLGKHLYAIDLDTLETSPSQASS